MPTDAGEQDDLGVIAQARARPMAIVTGHDAAEHGTNAAPLIEERTRHADQRTRTGRYSHERVDGDTASG